MNIWRAVIYLIGIYYPTSKHREVVTCIARRVRSIFAASDAFTEPTPNPAPIPASPVPPSNDLLINNTLLSWELLLAWVWTELNWDCVCEANGTTGEVLSDWGKPPLWKDFFELIVGFPPRGFIVPGSTPGSGLRAPCMLPSVLAYPRTWEEVMMVSIVNVSRPFEVVIVVDGSKSIKYVLRNVHDGSYDQSL